VRDRAPSSAAPSPERVAPPGRGWMRDASRRQIAVLSQAAKQPLPPPNSAVFAAEVVLPALLARAGA